MRRKIAQKYFENSIYVHHNEYWQFTRRTIRDLIGAQDVLQNAYLRMWKWLLTNDTPKEAKAWGYRVIINEAKNYLRKEGKHHRVQSNILTLPDSDDIVDAYEITIAVENNPLDEVVENFEKELALKALDYLNEEEKILITLCDIQEVPMKDLLEIYEVPYGTLSSKISRTRKKYRSLYFALENGKRKNL